MRVGEFAKIDDNEYIFDVLSVIKMLLIERLYFTVVSTLLCVF